MAHASNTRALLAGGLTVLLAACSWNPVAPSPRSDLARTTRTGQIHDVKIGDTISPKEVHVKPGDEIRWINMRNGNVRVVFIEPLRDRVACADNFPGSSDKFASPYAREFETKLSANQVASLCISQPGTYTYTTRMESTSPGGEIAETAMVMVDQPESGQVSTR